MYNWEINDFLEKNNNNITYADYMKIQMSSPQINHVIFNPYENNFKMWSDDGEYFEFTCIVK